MFSVGSFLAHEPLGSRTQVERYPKSQTHIRMALPAPVVSFLESSRPHAVLDKNQFDNLACLLELVDGISNAKVQQLLDATGPRPCLMVYSSDGTPARVSKRLMYKVAPSSGTEAFSFHRSGKGLREFLLQRVFYKAFDGLGRPRLVVEVHAPRPLLHGKKATDMFAACVQDVPLLPERKQEGITISQYCFDRLCFGALSRLCLQRHEEFHQLRAEEPGANFQRLLDWVVCTPCCNHDVQNSLKWSLKPHVHSPSVYDDLYLGIESIRNSHEYLHKAIPAFLGSTLQRADRIDEEHDVQQFWVAMGVEPVMLDILVQLNPRWSEGRLLVSTQLADSQTVDQLHTCLAYLLRLQKTSESRWATIGRACRALVACFSMGLPALVQEARRQGASDYYLGGFWKMDASSKEYMAVASLSSYLPDTLLQELLCDDRLATRSLELEEHAFAELEWLGSLSDYVWHRVVSTLGLSWSVQQLRSSVLKAAHTSQAYVEFKFLKTLRSLPWSLGRGEPAENLAALLSEPEPPVHQVAAQIWQLGQAGFWGKKPPHPKPPSSLVGGGGQTHIILYQCSSLHGLRRPRGQTPIVPLSSRGR